MTTRRDVPIANRHTHHQMNTTQSGQFMFNQKNNRNTQDGMSEGLTADVVTSAVTQVRGANANIEASNFYMT